MIFFQYETDFTLSSEQKYKQWIKQIIRCFQLKPGDISFIFCDDDYLSKLNIDFLQHNTLTDVITFDNSIGELIGGEIFISIDMVKRNSQYYDVEFHEELLRVMSHGVLHLCGLGDEDTNSIKIMREKEQQSILLFHSNN